MFILEFIAKVFWTLFFFFEEKAAQDNFLSTVKALTFLTLTELFVVRVVLNLLAILKIVSLNSYSIDILICIILFLTNLIIISKIKIKKKNTYNSTYVLITIILSFLIFVLSLSLMKSIGQPV